MPYNNIAMEQKHSNGKIFEIQQLLIQFQMETTSEIQKEITGFFKF